MDSIINVSAIQNIVYIGSSILFIFGIKMLGKEATAVRGNYLSAIAMFLAVGITCLNLGIDIKIIKTSGDVNTYKIELGDVDEVGQSTKLTIDDAAGSSGEVTVNKPLNTNVGKFTFSKTGTTDAEAQGDVVFFGGTTSMDAGKIYHYKSDGTWELADADAVATCDGLLAVALGAASDTNGMLLRGTVTLDHDPGAVGDVLFVSTVAGKATAAAPSGNTNIVRVIGYCLDASNGQIWFNPDNTFVEVSA